MKRSIAKPMSFSKPSTARANSQVTTIGMSGRGSTKRWLPILRDGIVSSSLVVAKYDAKKMTSRSFAISTGWNWIAADVDPQPRPVDLETDVGDHRGDEQEDRDQQQEVAVAVEVARAPDEEQRGDVERRR